MIVSRMISDARMINDAPDAAFLEKCSIVGIVVFADQKELFITMDQIRKGESPEECARRTACEKSGLQPDAIHSMQLLFGFSGETVDENVNAGRSAGENAICGVCFSALADLANPAEMADPAELVDPAVLDGFKAGVATSASISKPIPAPASALSQKTDFAAFLSRTAAERAFRIPRWNKAFSPSAHGSAATRRILQRERLHTVCSSAVCPNRGECHAHGTATFLILGNSCTRNCRFCAIDHGHPEPLNPTEPQRLAQAARDLGLRHIVITSVTRDDLTDGGASHFAACIHEIRRVSPQATIEVLPSDLGGNMEALAIILQAGPDVFNHNIETVPRLYKTVRPGADYRRSLDVLQYAHEHGQGCHVKSGMMVGLGETPGEVRQALDDLKEAGCDMVTIGQYLRPTLGHLPVSEFVSPGRFEYYEKAGREIGLRWVFAGPLVRSSYRAAEAVAGAAAGK